MLTKINPKERKQHGKMINGELHLNEGVHYTTEPYKELKDSYRYKTKDVAVPMKYLYPKNKN